MRKARSAGLIYLALLLVNGCGGGKGGGSSLELSPEDVTKTFGEAKTTKLDSGLIYQEVKEGKGAEAEEGKTVYVHYSGYFMNGAKFDSSYRVGQPFMFQLGTNRVIKGWDLGIAGMKEGGKRKLLIPSKLAYGAQGSGQIIPPYAHLVFDVELIKVN
jgi:FKBP-type peptidyl-prolyl cis-trans isomerase